MKVIAQTNIEIVTETIKEFIAPNSTMVTDEHHAYNRLPKEDILVHTNNIEGYWNILKKQIDGIHHSVSPKHLQRYCNENAFRYNHRESFQAEKFDDAINNCNTRLKYKELIAEHEG
ncbi:MAG: transposase [Chitinophagaceae bacterium]